MKIPRKGPVWFLIVGIPLVGISLAQLIVGLLGVGLQKAEKTLALWFEEIMEKYR
jgi:hypothetical protein